MLRHSGHVARSTWPSATEWRGSVHAPGTVTVPLPGVVVRRAAAAYTQRGGRLEQEGNTRSTPGNEGGSGAHCGTPVSGEAKEGFGAAAFFAGDRAPVGGGQSRGSLKHQADEGEVRGGPIKGGGQHKWSSPEGCTHDGGGFGFVALDGRFHWRGGQTVMPCCGDGGSLVHLGWCHVVEGGAKQGRVAASQSKQRGENEGEAGAGLGAPHGEEEEGGLGDL
jgi:hypothetical protein